MIEIGQYKPPHRDGHFFDENGERVPVVLPSQSELPPAEAVLEALADAPSQAERIAILERALDEHGDQRAAEALALILGRLPGGKHGVELRLALLKGCEVTAREARQLGIPRQILHRSVARLRKRIFKNG